MNKLNIWVVEDELAPHIERALDHELGPNGTCANYEVFPDPMEPIKRCEAASNPEELPDITLIDVNFDSRSTSGVMVDVDDDAKGFVVAAQLKHYAESLEKKFWTYKIYTGNENVRTKYRWLYENPFNNPALLPIQQKGAAVEPFDVTHWIREESHKLARMRLRDVDEDLSVLCRVVDETKLSLQGLWSEEWSACLADFRSTVQPEVVGFIEGWSKAVEGEPDLVKKNFLPLQRLKAAATSGAVMTALALAEGDKIAELSEILVGRIAEYSEKYASLILNTMKKVDNKTKAFVDDKTFDAYFRPLFPFEAWEIEGSYDPETIVRALRGILDILGETVDHTYNLARAFKFLRVPESTETLPVTVFAHACHKWVHKDKWFLGFPMPIAEKDQELLLREELCFTEVGEKERRVLKVSLPKETRDRIMEDGERGSNSGGLVAFPLNDFAKFSSKDHWIQCPMDYVKAHLNIEAKCEPQSFSSRREVLTDWRRVFGAGEQIGILQKIISEDKITRISDVLVRYDDALARVGLIFDFEVTDYLHRIDLREPSGGFTSTLREFWGWGKVVLYTNTENACYMTEWPGSEPKDVAGDTKSPVFKLEWWIPHYLESRCA